MDTKVMVTPLKDADPELPIHEDMLSSSVWALVMSNSRRFSFVTHDVTMIYSNWPAILAHAPSGTLTTQGRLERNEAPRDSDNNPYTRT